MKKILSCFSVIIILVFNQLAYAQPAELPHLKENESYASIRLKMLEAGWEPFRSEDADTCLEGDLRCEDRQEMEACASTGMANCKFL